MSIFSKTDRHIILTRHVIPAKAGICILIILMLCSCGEPLVTLNKTGASTHGSASVVIAGSKSTVSGTPYSKIEKYIVEVSGSKIKEPMTFEFSGDATSGSIDEIPVGSDIKFEVKALGGNGRPIRKGTKEDIEIIGGTTTDVDIEMSAIPNFINIIDGNVIANNRLQLKLFTDPDDLVEVLVKGKVGEKALFDMNTGTDLFSPDQSTGLIEFRPGPIEPGMYTFTAVSRYSQNSSKVAIQIIDGSIIRPAPLYGAAVNSGYGNARLEIKGANYEE